MRMETSSPASEAQTRGTNRPHTTPQHSRQTALSGQCTSSSTIQPTTSTATSTHTRYLARTNTSPPLFFPQRPIRKTDNGPVTGPGRNFGHAQEKNMAPCKNLFVLSTDNSTIDALKKLVEVHNRILIYEIRDHALYARVLLATGIGLLLVGVVLICTILPLGCYWS